MSFYTSLVDAGKNYLTNSGNPKDNLAGGGNSLIKDLQKKTDVRVNNDNNAGANSTSGYDPSRARQQSGPGGGAENPVELERIYPAEYREPSEVGTNINDPQANSSATDVNFRGTPSLINPYHLVRIHSLSKATNENPNHFGNLGVANDESNYTGVADNEAYKNPSTSFLVYYFNEGDGKKYEQYEKVYRYSDFLYLKHYHPFNNNRLITLRRFMVPVYDECRIALKKQDAKPSLRRPIAQALTYLDYSSNSLNSLTKGTVKIETKNIGETSGVNNITVKEIGNLFGLSATESTENNVGVKLLSLLSGNDRTDTLNTWTSAYDPWKNGPLKDLVYGPVNVIRGSKVRDRGLTFSHTPGLKVTFEYSSKTIEHVNQKAAMLDIFSNMLTLTYNHAQFWGGENRFLIDRRNFPLVRAEAMFKLLNDIGTGNYKDTVNELAKTANFAGGTIGKIIKDLTTNPSELLKGENVSAAAEYISQYLLKNNAELKTNLLAVLQGTVGELTGAPTGEWHLQVGNPFAPIMMIGNLWCTQCDYEFNDELSVDDFPTELKFSCTLEPGRSRDASDIQSLFNGGGGRIYYPEKSDVDVNKSSSTYSSGMSLRQKELTTLNAFGSTSVDSSGSKPFELVKSKNDFKTGLFQPIKTKI
jgi:hypothetical protein